MIIFTNVYPLIQARPLMRFGAGMIVLGKLEVKHFGQKYRGGGRGGETWSSVIVVINAIILI